MYGTVGIARVKDGLFDDMVHTMEQFDREYSGQIDGYICSYVYRLDNDPNKIILTAVFRDKASYLANADDPKQDAWYRAFRACLEADPEWNDGEIVHGRTQG